MSKQVKSSKKQPQKATSVKATPAKATPKAPAKKTAAYDDAMTDAFIMEVDEEVKNDNFKAFFNKYGLYIISIVAIVLFATVSFDQIKNWRENQFKEKTSAYIAANYAPSAQEKIIVLEKISAGGHGIYSELARIQIADLLFEQQKTEDALNMLDLIVSNDELDPRIRNLAAVKLAAAKLDTAPYAEIETLLLPVINEDDSWAPVAQEYLALSAIKNGNIEQAKKIYESLLQDNRISEDFKSRVQDMLATISDM